MMRPGDGPAQGETDGPGEDSPFRSLTFHHFAVATDDAKLSSEYLAALGYRRGANAYDPLQNVNLEMWHHAGMPDVELVWPSGTSGPVNTMLKKKGVGIYHVCYEVDDLAETVETFRAKDLNFLEVVEPRPAVLFGGRPVAFYLFEGFGLVELLGRA
ncbi:VOC family protein [Methylobacterium persicinum]|uniref:Methylmalonyl-CoA/ethylmalonyl-CoA epimerase n=1 Tax=Methylobacterium persicinum TaxID=374426 RepID=A0ABU0HSQ8_9HYPH|nr:VOC family protein [Methylobacterium persicinum]MDQ0444506.1 methylmalonyl-CoA/ethylmalonyl-CoA epimerase [Methylobacterium persicinum]GJE40402.1 Ethylmalonyl-CoA/methylmalonyl-CoA epimerase [Methylobacterium persicinum]